MPKILEDKQNNIYVYIYVNDHIPVHVHVFIGSKKSRNSPNMKINIGKPGDFPELVKCHPSIEEKDITKALCFIAENQQRLLDEWQKIHT